MEKQSSGVLALVKAHPLSPQALIHWRPSLSSGFSVKVLMAPSTPFFARFHLILAGFCFVRTSLPRMSPDSFHSTISAVRPSGGVGALHMPREVGTCW